METVNAITGNWQLNELSECTSTPLRKANDIKLVKDIHSYVTECLGITTFDRCDPTSKGFPLLKLRSSRHTTIELVIDYAVLKTI